MKRIFYILFIIFAFASAAYSVEDKKDIAPITLQDLENEHYFMSPAPEVTGVDEEDEDGMFQSGYAFGILGPSDIEAGSKLPVFMRTRLQLQNKIMSKAESLEANEDSEVPGKLSKTLKKLKFWNKDELDKYDVSDSDAEDSLTEDGLLESSIKDETKLSEEDTLALESGIVEQVADKELMLDSDKVKYDEASGKMIAYGRPVLSLPRQDMKIVSDEMAYSPDSNILKAYGNVYIYRKGVPTKTNYIEVDVNEETVDMEKVSMISDVSIIEAEKARQKDSILILENGKIHSEVSEIQRLTSRLKGPAFWGMKIDDDDKALFFGDPTNNKLNLDIDTLYIDAQENHNKYVAKNLKLYRNGKLGLRLSKLTAYTNKDGTVFEASYPEIGTKRGLGLFVGPGFLFKGPGGSVIKAMPVLNYKSGIGVGGLLRYRNTYNTTYFGYGSANDIFILRGRQRLDNNLFLQYGYNQYINEWFLGSRMPKYAAELYYEKGHRVKDFLAEGKTLTFRHRLGLGLMEDPDRNVNGEKFNSSGLSTTRLRYMAEINQSLYNYVNKEKDIYVNFSAVMQGSAAIYGTGDTQFIGRIGPRLHIQRHHWSQELEYLCSTYEDESPLQRYDSYRYGRSAVRLSEVYRVNKYLSVGWSGVANVSDDAPNGDILQENKFAVAVGPDDLKFRLGYDFVRKTSFMGFDVAFDTKGTEVNYKRMEIKNPERLGKSKDEREIAYVPPAKDDEEEEKDIVLFGRRQNQKSNVLKYAKVIDIEDPDKEQID